MQPTRDTHATLVDLLDRVLEKGLVLNADLLINVAGIPLLGVNLRACLAGVETMLKYGVWQDWDAAQRSIANKERQPKRAKEPISVSELIPEQNTPSSLYRKTAAEFIINEEAKIQDER
ncbi:MAG: gas vesicle protein [Dehalococcoidales bacterium]|jgi:hypothetical protein